MWLLLLLLLLLGLRLPCAAAASVATAPDDSPVPGAEGSQYPIVPEPGSGCSCKKKAPVGAVVCFDILTCVRFPGNVTVVPDPDGGLATLHVAATRIPTLHAGDLSRLQHLTELGVDKNKFLSRVEPGAFQGMSRLVNLSLTSNPSLTHLEVGALSGLPALRDLDLAGNGFLALADVTPALAALPSLRALKLDENALRGVAAADFAPMSESPLEELSLVRCGLGTVYPDGLAPLRRLGVLRLAENGLDARTLAAGLDNLRALHTLDLGAIGLTVGAADNATGPPDVPTLLLRAIARTNVTTLVLRHNAVQRLRPGSFPRMPGLRRLDLSRVDLSEGRPGALAADVVPDLEELDLSHNRLPGLERGFASYQLLALHLNASATPRFYLPGGVFAGMDRLQVLHLSHNHLLRLTNQTLQGLHSLRVLTMCNTSLYKLDDGAFLSMRRLEHLDLQRNWFPTVRPMSASMFLGLGRLKVLLLAACNITSLGPDPAVFRHLGSLTHLKLQDNALTSLDGSRAFGPLRALQHLDVSHNRIASWSSARLFAANGALRELLAAGNTLTYLSAAMLEDMQGLDAVDLADNTFHCGCDLYRPVRERLDLGQDAAAVAHRLTSRYTCLSPDRWRDHPIAEYVQRTSEQPSCAAGAAAGLTAVLVVVPPLGVLLVLLAGAAALACRYRHHIRYYYSVAKRRTTGAGPGGAAAAAYVNYLYDAFVSYSCEDQAFVHLLVSTLEGEAPHFRLCVYERDFEAGTAITEAVLASVAQSRRVVLVVSPAFARSHWCAWEAHIAHHQRLLAEDGLLVVRLGEQGLDEELLTPTLRYLLSTRIYLEWLPDADPDRQRAFWRRLRSALGTPVQVRTRAAGSATGSAAPTAADP